MSAPAPRSRLGGRPRIALRDHPFKLVLAFADAMQAAGFSAQKARLLASTLFFAESAEPLLPENFSQRLRRAFEQEGGLAVTYKLPASGNPTSKKIKEQAQAVDTLGKMAQRYIQAKDLRYRVDLAALMTLAVFARGGPEIRDQMIDALVVRLADSDPDVKRLAALAK